MVYDKARELAKMIGESEEYQSYKALKEKALENDTTKALIKEYHQIQIQAQAAIVAGQKDEAAMERLQKIGEILQMNQDASAYLISEYRLNRMLGDVYKILADAIDANLDMLD